MQTQAEVRAVGTYTSVQPGALNYKHLAVPEDGGVLEDVELGMSASQPGNFPPVWNWGYSAILIISGVFGDSCRPGHPSS